MESCPTSIPARFGWFAAGHLIVSLITCGVMFCIAFPLSALAEGVPSWLPLTIMTGSTVFAIGGYFIAGAYTAKARRWTPPSSKEDAVLAVLLPALVAWTWEGVAIAGMAGETAFLQALAAFLLYIALFLAAPSVLFIFFCATILGAGMFFDDMSFWVMVVLAGFLPPLLFALGSFWQASRTPVPAPPDASSSELSEP